MDENGRKKMFKKAFDTVATVYDNRATRFFPESVPHLVPFLDLNGKEQILDVATGTGHTALQLAEHVPAGKVCGIDFSKGMLAKAEEKRGTLGINNVSFTQMDMSSLQWPDDHFDRVVSSFGIFFVEDMVSQLIHMAAKVKSRGKIAITTFYKSSFSPQGDLFLDRIEQYGVEIPPTTWKRTDTQPKCRALFQEAGLTDIVTHQKDIGYPLNGPEQWWDILWNAGYRGLITQLSEEKLAVFKKDHLAEVGTIATEKGLWLDIEVIYTIGTQP